VKAIAVIVNFFIPGLGSLVIGKVFQGLMQLLLSGLGWLFTATVIGAIVGLPLVAIAWIWGMITAATYREPVRVVYERR
jgi:TM2 domain-containing membrane protein YozV